MIQTASSPPRITLISGFDRIVKIKTPSGLYHLVSANMGPPAPPPPPPLPSSLPRLAESSASHPSRPAVPEHGPPGSYLAELLVYSGNPFKDHWALFVGSLAERDIGIRLDAEGNVRNGFQIAVQHGFDFKKTTRKPTRIPLQWVDGAHFDEAAMLNQGNVEQDGVPLCGFETSALKAPAPGPSLNASDSDKSGQKVVQRNCQTWIVEASGHLVQDGIFTPEVETFLRGYEQ